MKKIAWILLICVSGVSNTLCPTAYAVNQAYMGSFTVGGNGLFLSPQRNMHDTGGPFIAASYNFTPQWGIDGLLSSFNTNFTSSVNNPTSINGTLALVDAMYHFPSYFRDTVQPYALAGVGIMGLNHNQEDPQNEGVVNVGLGLQFFVDEVVSFRLEARDVYSMISAKNDVFVGGGVTFSIGGCTC